MLKIVDFLRYVLKRDNLTIEDYLGAMGQAPFFLVAATGLGKTVAVPIHVFLRLMENIGQASTPHPRVWVVEPRIPIAIDQMKFMNSLWAEYLRSKKEKPLSPLFGCITSASGNVNRDAPIKFVTTGIFELMAKGDELSPARDRVIIDEAHVTVEQNPGVELGIALARKIGVPIDYMSATVDTTTLQTDLGIDNIIRADKQRNVIWKHNLLKPLDEILVELVKATLVHPDPSSDYFPSAAGFSRAREVCEAVLEAKRSHGLLVVANSFAGEQSDIKRFADKLRASYPDLPVFMLASEIVRDAKRQNEFQQRLREAEGQQRNYVILATSVVEMGITFPTLDFVVTMDSGYDQETIGDVTFPVIAPLGVNSLLQRLGRVGRRRPGIAYISYEVGAPYADLDDSELNSSRLAYESIRFPLASAPLTALAYYACRSDWAELESWVRELGLPSRLHENTERMEYLAEQLDMLEGLGIAENGHLTPFGERMERWIGQADLAYAVQLQLRFEEGCDLPELAFWLVATALSNVPLVTLRAQHDYFVDFHGSHAAIAHEIDIWRGFWHEDLAMFGLLGHVAEMMPSSFFGGAKLSDWDRDEVDRWCNMIGIDARKLLRSGSAINDLWGVFCQINSKSDRFNTMFNGGEQSSLAGFPWAHIRRSLPAEQIHRELTSFPGASAVSMTFTNIGNAQWHSHIGDHQGLVNQDDTPIHLRPDLAYIARLIPSREAKGSDTSWRLAHLGILLPPARSSAMTQPHIQHQASPRSTSFLDRLRQSLGI